MSGGSVPPSCSDRQATGRSYAHVGQHPGHVILHTSEVIHFGQEDAVAAITVCSLITSSMLKLPSVIGRETSFPAYGKFSDVSPGLSRVPGYRFVYPQGIIQGG